MMIIRLTQKLVKKIKVAPTTVESRTENPFTDWTANLFTVGRAQYIILTHSASLYSVVFPGRGINDSGKFIKHVLLAMGGKLLGVASQLLTKGGWSGVGPMQIIEIK